MNINLGVQWEEYIAVSVKSGRYLSASEVVREGLRLLEERDQLRNARLEQLRNEVAVGIADLDRKAYEELDEKDLKSHLKRVKQRGRARLARDKSA